VGGGDVHLLHVTLTPSIGRHPSQAIVQPCCCGYALIFKQGGTARPTRVLRCLDYRYVFFWPSMSLLCL
jgi:hypothetical protein